MKYFGIGRRKAAIAKVVFLNIKQTSSSTKESTLYKNIFVNNKRILNYFKNDFIFIQNIEETFELFGLYQTNSIKMQIATNGGGQTGQKEAICLAIARALVKGGFHPLKKKPNLLTQDTRQKERKKYGLKKARKAPQYSKR
uniref:Small ribosomal subunit protein uS9c n=1 Tax=Boodleopsis sp. FL1161 TaxID=2364084 RepID=A0A386AZ91_9CHLO|nr:ribosomal protein S9 [Boodleopsis sp. FL1161]